MLTMILIYLVGAGLTYVGLRMKDGWRSGGAARPMAFGLAIGWPIVLPILIWSKIRGR